MPATTPISGARSFERIVAHKRERRLGVRRRPQLVATATVCLDRTVRSALDRKGRNDHVLLLSPWPESLLAFEPIWARPAEHVHLVAIDLPGFGHFERRDSLLSPQAMGEFVIRVADAFGSRAHMSSAPTLAPRPRSLPRHCIRAGCVA
jgi:pimeloyl-ACP methyl ester carboxylesterase